MIPPQTQQVLDFLGDPASYDPRPAAVQLHQTHASWVFVAPPYVYKIKKPVDFGFMDFTTLEKRHANCEREVELNRRLTQDIYLGVEAISIRDGNIQFGKEGEIVEWAVKMREMNPHGFLSHKIEEKTFDQDDLSRIVAKLTKFYCSHPPLSAEKSQAAANQLQGNIAANYLIARQYIPQCLSQTALHAIEDYSQQFQANHQSLFAERCASGAFRDCHGDLHAEHIYFTPDQVHIYDCIEFNSAFREIDIACDVAFLAMDLDYRGRNSEANELVRRIAAQLADPVLLRLVDYYKCYRACVRGKVEALSSSQDEIADKDRWRSVRRSRRYFRLALRYALTGSKATVVVCMGQSGAGKSTLARELGRATGWTSLSSDRIRKQLAGIDPHTRVSPQERAQLYCEEMSTRVYNHMIQTAVGSLQQDRSTLVDATFARRTHRDLLKQALKSVGAKAIWIEACAEPKIRLQRLHEREGIPNVSDARGEDFAKLQNAYEPPNELDAANHIQIDTGAASDSALERLMSELVRRNAR